MHLTIAMLTYRRNDYLAQVIPELLAQADDVSDAQTTASVLIVDNDPQAGARAVVEAARAALAGEQPEASEPTGRADTATADATSRLVYVHEPEPGIVAGRNRALSQARGSDVLVFIDDDEIPSPGWLKALVSTWRDQGCAAVTGPTPPTFEVDPSPWVTASGAFDSWEAADGAQVRSADTGNLLLDLAVVEGLGLRFDPRYGLTGGEGGLAPGALGVVVDDEDLDVADAPTGRPVRTRRTRSITLGFAGLGAQAADQLTGLLQDTTDGPLQVLRAPEGGDGDRQPAHALLLPAGAALRRRRGRPYSRTCPPSAPTTMPSPPREETS